MNVTEAVRDDDQFSEIVNDAEKAFSRETYVVDCKAVRLKEIKMAGAAYVVFDGDEDKWAYAYMNGWKTNRNINFTYENAHDLDNMTKSRSRRSIREI